jgi:broad-specificity NMP kinase
MRASNVSAKLRDLGYNPVAASDRMRQGLRITGSSAGRVRVVADLDSDREALAMISEVHATLAGLGWNVKRVPEFAVVISD